MRRLLLIAAVALTLSGGRAGEARAQAMAPPLFDTPVMDEAALDATRGGFALPGGIEVALGAQISTSVDGRPLFQSLLQIIDGPPQIQVLTGAGQQAPSGAGLPGGGTQVSIRFGTGGSPTAPATGGGNGGGVTTQSGGVSVALPADVGSGLIRGSTANGSTSITYASSDLQVTHILGNSIGTIVANSADNRVVDTSISIDLQLSNVAPLAIGSAAGRIDRMGFDSVGQLLN